MWIPGLAVLLKRLLSQEESGYSHRKLGTVLPKLSIFKKEGGWKKFKAQEALRICDCGLEGKRCRGLHTTNSMLSHKNDFI